MQIREVRIKEFVESLGNGNSTSQYKVVSSQGEDDPLVDLGIIMEGLALIARVSSKYQEQDMSKTREQVFSYLSQAFERHDKFKFIPSDNGNNIPKPNN